MVAETTFIKPLKSQVKLWEKLRQGKYRRQEGLFLAEGFKVVQELLNSDWESSAILVSEKKVAAWKDFLCSVSKKTQIYQLTESDLIKLSQDKTPEGIMALVVIPRCPDMTEWLAREDAGHLLLLWRINNPNNLGAVIRSAHWFGIKKILLSAGSVDFTNAKVVRSTMGSLFHVTVVSEVDFAETLPEIKEHYFMAGSHHRQGVEPHPCMKKTAILLGSESHGLPEALLRIMDETWCISGADTLDSLSLPQAAAIMMYECVKPSGFGNEVEKCMRISKSLQQRETDRTQKK